MLGNNYSRATISDRRGKPMADGDNFNSLFAQYTRLRQSGVPREHAWSKLELPVLQLAQPERDRLLALLRSWEAKEGREHQASLEGDPYQTHHSPPPGLVDVLGDMQQSAGLPESSGVQLRGIKRINNTQQPEQPANAPSQQPHVCSNCGTANRPGEILCAKCGQALQGGIANPGSTHRLATHNGHDNTFFDDQTVLALRVEGADNVIRLRPSRGEVVIGRRSPESVMIPDVDLAQYNAESKGVSRLHAALQRHETTLVLTDMGSLNHTYINGQRVHAHEVRVVHDGDQLQFGQLRVNVYFEQG